LDTATIQWIISLVLCIIAWFCPDSSWYWKVIFILGIMLLSVSISWFRLSQNLKKSQRAQNDIKNRHEALAAQFDEKNAILNKYRRALSEFNLILHLALQNTKEAKLEDIYRAYLIALDELTDGGNSDDQ
jgi:endonuclease/exonuclease/phosphatase (EEP) superfamily protein YafD